MDDREKFDGRKMPSWVRLDVEPHGGWTVDEVIECLPISKDVEHGLLKLAPRCYDERVHVRTVWYSLPIETRRAIFAAFEQEYED